jgi:hypothetical protein
MEAENVAASADHDPHFYVVEFVECRSKLMLANRKFKAILIATLVIAGCCLLFDAGLKTALGVLLVGSAIAFGIGVGITPNKGRSAPPAPGGTVPAAFEAHPEAGTYCISCGTHNPQRARFCRKCGGHIEDVDFGVGPDHGAKASPPAYQSSDAQSEEHVNEAQNHPQGPTQYASDDMPPLGASFSTPAYGSLFERFLAYVGDLAVIYLLFLGLAFFIGLSKGLGMTQPTLADDEYQLLFLPVLWIYMTVSLIATRTTVGKYVLGLEIASVNDFRPKSRPSIARIVLRETVGRIVSSCFLAYGYWRASGSPKRQAWSDQMGRSIVRHRTVRRAARGFLMVFVFAALISDIAFFSWSEELQRRQKLHQEWESKLEVSSNRVTVARDAVASLMGEDSVGFDKLQANMRRALTSLDAYEREINEHQELYRAGLRDNLAMSEREGSQVGTLIEVMELRKQQAELERTEANDIVGFDPTSGDAQALKAKLEPLDKQIQDLNKTASDSLIRAGITKH